MRRRTCWGAFALALSTAFVALGGGVAQAAATCPAGSDRWNGTGAWNTTAGWSSGQIPESQNDYEPDVCIQSGTVTLNYETQVNSISVLGGATLNIWGQAGYTHGLLTLTSQDAGIGVAAGGSVNFGYFGTPSDNAYETHGGFDAVSGTIVNDGSITSAVTGDETPNLLEGSFDNEGSLTVDNALSATAGNWTLGGTVDNTTGQAITLAPGSSGTGTLNLTGAITNSGAFTISDGISVTATSGTDSGNAFVLGNDTLSASGSGSGSFHFEAGGAKLGSNIASGYTVWGSGIPGFTHGDIVATGNFTNYGTLEFGSTDGTHGTLTVDPGNTFTNAGTLIFENTQNGPDGLSGAFVNDGSVTADGQFEGNGAITNNGRLELTSASGVSSAATFTQGAAGTLLLDVTGGASATVPELQLTGAAALGGTLKVVTTGGTATGSFPIMFATSYTGAFGTSFSGENYSLSTNASVLSLKGPARASANRVPAAVKAVSGGRGSFSVKLACPAADTCAADTVTATRRVVTKVHGKRKTVTKLVVKKVEAIASGKSKTVTIAVPRSLLHHGSIQLHVTITSGRATLKSVTVRIRPARKRKK